MRIHAKLLLSTATATFTVLSLMLIPAFMLLKSSLLVETETFIEHQVYTLNHDLEQLLPLARHQLKSLARTSGLQPDPAASEQPKTALSTAYLDDRMHDFIASSPLFNEVVLLSDNHTQLAWTSEDSNPFRAFASQHPTLIRKLSQQQELARLIPYQNPHSHQYEKWLAYQFTAPWRGANIPPHHPITLTLLARIDEGKSFIGLNRIYIDEKIHLAEVNPQMRVVSGSPLLQKLPLQSLLQANSRTLEQERLWQSLDGQIFGFKLHRLNDQDLYLSTIEQGFISERLRLFIITSALVILPALLLIIIWLRIELDRHLQQPIEKMLAWLKRMRKTNQYQEKFPLNASDVDEVKALSNLISHTVRATVEEKSNLITEAFTEHTSGLTNQRGLDAKLTQLIAQERSQQLCSLLLFKVSRLLPLAARAGNNVAEHILILLIQRLQRECQRLINIHGKQIEILFYRLRYDELAILIIGSAAEQPRVQPLAVALKKLGSRQIQYQGHTAELNLIAGTAQLHSRDCQQLISQTRQALTKAEATASGIASYNQEVAEYWQRMEQLKNMIAQSDFSQDLKLAFQPIIDATTLKIVALEAVVKFTNQHDDLASNSTLLDFAIKAGRGIELDSWIATEAIHTLNRLAIEGYHNLPIAINASTSSFCCHEYIQQIEESLDHYQVSGSMLIVELNESSLLSEQLRVIRHAEMLDVLGVGISIDDLGTDSTSLAVLRELPLHSFKISAEIVSELGKSNAAENVIDIAHIFNIPTIATGVETEYQERRLTELECSHLQGPRFYPPLSFEQLLPIISIYEMRSV